MQAPHICCQAALLVSPGLILQCWLCCMPTSSAVPRMLVVFGRSGCWVDNNRSAYAPPLGLTLFCLMSSVMQFARRVPLEALAVPAQQDSSVLARALTGSPVGSSAGPAKERRQPQIAGVKQVSSMGRSHMHFPADRSGSCPCFNSTALRQRQGLQDRMASGSVAVHFTAGHRNTAACANNVVLLLPSHRTWWH